MARGQDTHRPLHGVALKIASVTVFMGMAVCVKLASDEVPPGEIVFFRSFFAIPVIVFWLWQRHELATGLKTDHPMAHVWRGMIGASAMGLSFTALGLLPLPEVTAIGYASPLLVVVFAAMFLGERIRLYRLSAVFLGLIGVMVMLAPRLSVAGIEAATKDETLGAMAMLLGAVFMALATCFVRKMVETEESAAIVFYFSLTCTVLSLFTLPFGWVLPSLEVLGLLILAGLLGGVAQIFLTESFRHGDASLIAPFEYASMVMSLAIGWFVFAEAPRNETLTGAVLVIAAGLVVIWRERQLGLERKEARRAVSQNG
ncbi:MAG: DMT family transporter [Pseudomonadota bacterium]